MKVHSEISISRVVLYISFLVSLSGGNLSENDLPNGVETNVSQENSIPNDNRLMRNLQDTGVDQHQVYWDKYGVDK